MTEIKNHGARTLEINSQVSTSDRPTDSYLMDVYLYLPSSLGIDGENYNVADFYSDIRNLTRYGTIYIPIKRLVEEDCELSPLNRIRENLAQADSKKDIEDKKIIYELKTLVNIYDTETSAVLELMNKSLETGQTGPVHEKIRTMVKEIRLFLSQWRSLKTLFMEPTVGDRLRDAYALTDESISIITERVVISAMETADQEEKRILKLMSSELDYRQDAGLDLGQTEQPSAEPENRILRESMLKKWGQSALYLNTEESQRRRNVSHILAAVSAATAMIFAVSVTILADRFLPGQGFAWAVAIVVSYIFKDRIKEILRELLVRTIPGVVTDRRTLLVDQEAGKTIGYIKNSVDFPLPSGVPGKVRRAREKMTSIHSDLLPRETVLHYSRRIRIHTRKLQSMHRRFDSIIDILRLRLDDILKGTDDTLKTIQVFSSSEPVELTGKRLYPIAIILRIKELQGSVLRRYSLMLSQDGIESIAEQN